MDSQAKLRSASSRTLQEGQAAIILLLIVGFGIAALVFGMATPAKESIERDKKTAAALAKAKEALIGFAVAVDLSAGGPRPGDLPCPDKDDNGFADVTIDIPCAGGALGRLPWKSLGLPDLRDGDGERLWYAVSSNFKNNPRTACNNPGDAGCLNSDTRGTITVRDSAGTVVNNGNDPAGSFNPSGIIAVIIAPGAVLQRQGAGAPQDRSCTVGVDCDANERCTASPPTLTPRCNPQNYLDVVTTTEDNADFVDGSTINGFINGNVLAGGNVIVNDRILTITYADLLPLLEKRVAKEALNCLNAYASVSQNNGRYPWAAPIGNWPSFADQANTRFGRVPDGPLGATFLGIGGPIAAAVCPITPALCMQNNWPAACSTTQGTWWTNWKEMVLYGVAEAYQPADPAGTIPLPLPVPPGGPCGNCLTVDPPSGTDNKRVVVAVAGKSLAGVAGGQPRNGANKQLPQNYLEDQNGDPPGPPYLSQNIYTQKPATATFNDVLLFQQ